MGDLAGAEAQLREALRLGAKYAMVHNNLGVTLLWQGNLEGAIAEYKEALRIDPKQSYALANLPKVERMLSMSPRLPDVLKGKTEPRTPEEACAFGELCTFQKRYAAAVRLYDRAFAADPKLAADLGAAYRYTALCSALRAVDGQGVDSPADATARTDLRHKAFSWLRADLELRRKQFASADAAERRSATHEFTWWLQDPDLSIVRDPAPLAKLPAAEREEWVKVWADVKATLAYARKPALPAEKKSKKK